MLPGYPPSGIWPLRGLVSHSASSSRRMPRRRLRVFLCPCCRLQILFCARSEPWTVCGVLGHFQAQALPFSSGPRMGRCPVAPGSSLSPCRWPGLFCGGFLQVWASLRLLSLSIPSGGGDAPRRRRGVLPSVTFRRWDTGRATLCGLIFHHCHRSWGLPGHSWTRHRLCQLTSSPPRERSDYQHTHPSPSPSTSLARINIWPA